MKSTTKEKPMKEQPAKEQLAKEQPEKKARTTKADAEPVEIKAVAPTKTPGVIKKAAVVISLDQVAERAYQLWQSRGCVHGYQEQDWLQAEDELLRESNN